MKAQELERIAALIAGELKKPLPGVGYQLKMAPSSRRLPDFSVMEKQAAVLILLFPAGEDLSICFIRRSEYEGVHSGQISFPGGMAERSDNSLEQTARRETAEETGIDGAEVRMLGRLTPLPVPVSRFLVHPYVGYLPYRPQFIPDPTEVSFMIEAPLRLLLDPVTVQKEKWNLMNESVMVPFYVVESHRIWGATAMILSEFLEIISRVAPVHRSP